MTLREKIINRFLSDISHKPGFKILQDPRSYTYNVEETRMNTDPFVRKAMKLWDVNIYRDLDGFTKKVSLESALNTITAYSHYQKGYSNIKPEYKPSIDHAVEMARRTFIPSQPLYRYALSESFDNMNLDSAAGFSFPGFKKSEVIEEAYDISSYMQHRLQRGIETYAPPCKLALRGHLSELTPSAVDDDLMIPEKTRPIWVYPFEVTGLEGKWAIPFYKHLEESVDTVHFGEGSMVRLAKYLVSNRYGEDLQEVTLDWKSFDAMAMNYIIDRAFDIIWDSFDNRYAYIDGKLVYGGDVMVKKNLNLFKWLRKYFKKTKLMLPNGKVVQKLHGIPSGSFFTQAVGSIVNYIMVQTLVHHNKWVIADLKVLGDDSCFKVVSPLGTINKHKLAEQAKECFGAILHPEKVKIARKQMDRTFLGYKMHGYRYVRDTYDWFKMVLYPEHDVECLEQSASRVLAYYILGGCNDVDYCKFFWDYYARYPGIRTSTLKPSRGIQRMFKYVFRLPQDILMCPDFRRINLFSVGTTLSLGTPCF